MYSPADPAFVTPFLVIAYACAAICVFIASAAFLWLVTITIDEVRRLRQVVVEWERDMECVPFNGRFMVKINDDTDDFLFLDRVNGCWDPVEMRECAISGEDIKAYYQYPGTPRVGR